MPEELRPIGGEVQPDETTREVVGIERQPDAGTFGAYEQAPEKAVETANEKYSEILPKPSSQGSSVVVPEPSPVEVDAKAVYDETDAEARITKLVSLAEAKGIEHAVKVAQKLDDFYVLDRMHDELSGSFYEALKAKGLINEQ